MAEQKAARAEKKVAKKEAKAAGEVPGIRERLHKLREEDDTS